MSFQPSEVAKITLVLYLAHILSRKGSRGMGLANGLFPFVLAVTAVALPVALQPDFGSAALLGLLGLAILFLAEARVVHILSLLAAAALASVPLIVGSNYRMARILSFVNPWADAQGRGFQIIQSWIAFGQGGVLGQGLGAGRQKLFFLPEPHTDFIFATLGEELGLVGVLGVITLFGVLAWLGFSAATRVDDEFRSLVAAGMCTIITLQAAVNMGVVLGIVPTTGLTLPFIGYGGSSLVINLVAVGLLLNASHGNRETAAGLWPGLA